MSAQQDIQIRVADDKRTAVVRIPASFDISHMSGELLGQYAQDKGVHLTPDVRKKLAQIAEQFRAAPAQMEVAFANATPPTHGSDGALSWVEGFNPQPPGVEDEQSERVDHYAGQSFVQVREGDHVATLRLPTDGEDGVNVLGQAIKATPGRPCPIKIESSLRLDEHHRVITKADGVLRLTARSLEVTNALDVTGYVDFESGNINFDGSVNIREGVRDKFVVEATGDICVGGLIESATIKCGGNFTCRRGVAARDESLLQVEGDAEIGFLNNASGIVHGDLIVRREVINSDLGVGGRFLCEAGSIIGGTLRVGSEARIGILGSDAESITTIILGTAPVVERQMRARQAAIVKLKKQLRVNEEKLAQLQMYGQRASAADRERMTELSFEVAEMARELAEHQAAQEAMQTQLKELCQVSLTVLKHVHANVRFETGDLIARMKQEIRGPVHFGWNQQRELSYRTGSGESRPLSDIASITHKPNTPATRMAA